MKHVATTSGNKLEFESFLNFSNLCWHKDHTEKKKVSLYKSFSRSIVSCCWIFQFFFNYFFLAEKEMFLIPSHFVGISVPLFSTAASDSKTPVTTATVHFSSAVSQAILMFCK